MTIPMTDLLFLRTLSLNDWNGIPKFYTHRRSYYKLMNYGYNSEVQAINPSESLISEYTSWFYVWPYISWNRISAND